jgi:hypothetical protein
MSEWWLRVHRFLFCWVHCGPSSYFTPYEEGYVVLRLVVLVALAWLAAWGCYRAAIIGSALLAIDILLFNTAVVFETGGLGDPLRSIVLTMIAYASLSVAFAPGWIAFRFDSGAGARTWDQLSTGIYQSVRALTTTGPEGALYPWERLFASFETLVGIYFLAIILAGYVSWLNDGRAP